MPGKINYLQTITYSKKTQKAMNYEQTMPHVMINMAYYLCMLHAHCIPLAQQTPLRNCGRLHGLPQIDMCFHNFE